MAHSEVLDRTYAALADPTRRALLEALRNGPARITELAEPFSMTFAGVSRQIAVLERAGLLQREVRAARALVERAARGPGGGPAMDW